MTKVVCRHCSAAVRACSYCEYSIKVGQRFVCVERFDPPVRNVAELATCRGKCHHEHAQCGRERLAGPWGTMLVRGRGAVGGGWWSE